MEKLKRQIDSIITQLYLDDESFLSDENTYSHNLVIQILKTLKEAEVFGNLGHFADKVEWNAWKLKGKLETKNGDLCFIFDFINSEHQRVIGVGFLEAKKVNNGTFTRREIRQFNTLTNSVIFKYIFYNPQGLMNDNKETSCVGLQTAGYTTQDLNRGVSLGSQIVDRYLKGWDLNDLDPAGPNPNDVNFKKLLKYLKEHLGDSYLLISSSNSAFENLIELLEEDEDAEQINPPKKLIMAGY